MLEGVVTYPLLGFGDEFGEDFYSELPGPVPHVHGLLVDAAIEDNTDGGGGVEWLTRIELLGPLGEDLIDIVHDEVLSGRVDLVDEVVE